jgi:hypothetical protein
MALWQRLASAAIIVLAARLAPLTLPSPPGGEGQGEGTASAQTYSLTETPKAGDCFRIHLEMTLSGEIHLQGEAKPSSLPLHARAEHDFPERILAISAKGLPEKSARVYETAQAVITVGGDRTERTLRSDRRLQVALRHNDQLLTYSPAGPLTREELSLTGEHFDTLSLTGLLPQKEVEVGATWKVPDGVAQALCNFEGLTAQDFICKLDKVEDQIAHVSVKGSASGIDLGAMVKLSVEADYDYYLSQHRLTALVWKQKDERDSGPASPASTEESTTKLTRATIEQPSRLSDVALVSVPDGFDPPPQMIQLYYCDPKSRFDLVFAREWQIVSQTNEHVVMRMLDRGDFVAQVTITPWSSARPGEHLSGEAFQEQMAKVPGWEQTDVLQAGEAPSDGGRWIYRISALGQLEGVKVMQNFYLVAGPGGEQVVLAFTMTQAQAEKLAARDLALAGSIDFPAKKK